MRPWSFSTNRDKAEWFANRFAMLEGGYPMLSIGTVDKSDVLAYLLGRGEFEILAPPDKVSIEATIRVRRS